VISCAQTAAEGGGQPIGVAQAALVRTVRPGFPRPQPTARAVGWQTAQGIGEKATRSLTGG
jgi:hypothetical protein